MAYIISKPWGGSCGVGHQFCNWVVAWQLANQYDLKFVHAPFCGNTTEPQIDVPVKFWEDFLNFGQNEIQESQLSSDIKKIKLPLLSWKGNLWLNNTCDNKVWRKIIEEHRNNNVLFECVQNQFMMLDMSCLQSNILRMRYWDARYKHPMPCIFDTTKLNIAIHIRRGDVTSCSSAKDRWMSIKTYVNIINQIYNFWGNQAVFHIYSDGTVKDLEELVNLPNIIFHLREDVFTTFHHMVMADVLVVGKSSFSALAGHLQNKVKIIQPWNSITDMSGSLKRSVGLFTWKNLPDNEYFVAMGNDGELDIKFLRAQLDKLEIKGEIYVSEIRRF